MHWERSVEADVELSDNRPTSRILSIVNFTSTFADFLCQRTCVYICLSGHLVTQGAFDTTLQSPEGVGGSGGGILLNFETRVCYTPDRSKQLGKSGVLRRFLLFSLCHGSNGGFGLW
jgi:hypothetical protein